jgi:hypothetical protein
MKSTQLNILRNLIREEVKKSLATKAPINEAFASSILKRLLAQKTYRTTIAPAFQKMAQIALDKVTDDAITKMDPQAAYMQLRKSNAGNKVVVFYVSEKGTTNTYAKDTYYQKIAPGTVLGLASGDNKFFDVNYIRYGEDKDKMTMSAGKSGDSVGISKSGSGYGSTGLYNVKRVAEVADTAYMVDLEKLKDKGLGTSGLAAQRAIAKRGAVAFKSDAQFKKENLARYKEALQGRAAKGDIDTMVLEAIQQVTKQISAAVSGKSLSQYGDVLIGKSPKGREVTASDASNALNRLLQDFSRYSAAKIELEKNIATGGPEYRSNYPEAKVKEHALDIKNQVIKINKLDYGW